MLDPWRRTVSQQKGDVSGRHARLSGTCRAGRWGRLAQARPGASQADRERGCRVRIFRAGRLSDGQVGNPARQRQISTPSTTRASIAPRSATARRPPGRCRQAPRRGGPRARPRKILPHSVIGARPRQRQVQRHRHRGLRPACIRAAVQGRIAQDRGRVEMPVGQRNQRSGEACGQPVQHIVQPGGGPAEGFMPGVRWPIMLSAVLTAL